jgi:hypothetical protein
LSELRFGKGSNQPAQVREFNAHGRGNVFFEPGEGF